jgi:predicted acylesterase/phospholipase RssA
LSSRDNDHGSDGVLERRAEIEAPLEPKLYSALKRLVTDGKHRLVVSFGGGSVPGLCGNVALARILEELELQEQVGEVWGTSAGAVIGGGWSTGTPAMQILDLVQSMKRRGAIDVCWSRLAFSALLSPLGCPLPDGIIRGRRFLETIDSGLAVKTFEECKIPFRCIASSDDGQTRRKVFRHGPLLPAIAASLSVPGLIALGLKMEGETCGYYDGGLVEKTPLLSPIAEHARLGDERELVVMATHFGNEARKMSARGFINRFLQSIYAVEDQVWAYQLAEARRQSKTTVIFLNPRIDDPHLLDFRRTSGNYLQAREAFKEALQDARLLATFFRD